MTSVAAAQPPKPSCAVEQARLEQMLTRLQALGETDLDSFLLGTPPPGPGALDQSQAVRKALVQELGQDCRCIPIIIAPGDAALQRVSRKLRASDKRVLGFEFGNVVFLPLPLGRVRPMVLIHEILHARSERFNAEVSRRRMFQFHEGLTQYLTAQTMVHQFQTPFRELDVYIRYWRFMSGIARWVGEAPLRAAYFQGDLAGLERALDLVLGPSAFAKATGAMERSDFVTAMLTLGLPQERLNPHEHLEKP